METKEVKLIDVIKQQAFYLLPSHPKGYYRVTECGDLGKGRRDTEERKEATATVRDQGPQRETGANNIKMRTARQGYKSEV